MSVSRVVLIGAPGAGKSTVGRLLAERLNWTFIDTDAVVEELEQRTVAEIFIESGEPYFRERETAAVAQALETNNAVISLGGGAVLESRTQSALAGVPVVWLHVSVDSAVRRVGMQAARPLLLGNVRSRFVSLLAERSTIYTSLATLTVDTDNREADLVADQIWAWLATQGAQ